MPKLYFKYGAMGSSKTAAALMCKFNYEQKGYKVLLIKNIFDTRDMENGMPIVKSRIGLKSECVGFSSGDNLLDVFKKFYENGLADVVILDECNFASAEHIEQLKQVSQIVPVLCYGLLTDFNTNLFEGSKRLIEIADSISEIKSICKCGRKASVNARFLNNKIVCKGEKLLLGGDEGEVRYEGMCYWCYKKLMEESGE